ALCRLRHRQDDRADRLLVRECVGEVVQLEVERSTLEIGSVRLLDTDRAELDRHVADHVGEERRGVVRIYPLVLELVVGRSRERNRRAVRGLDGATVAPEVGEQLARVARGIRELAAAPDLQIRELRDETDEEHDHRHADVADARIHRALDGDSARTESSEMRSRIARRAKFATREDPPYETNGNEMPVSGMTR